MNRWLLAAALLMGCAGFATADYIIIVANVGTEKELNTLAGAMPGAYPGAPGMPAAGMPAAGMPAAGGALPTSANALPTSASSGGMRGGRRAMGGMTGMPGMPRMPGMPGMPGVYGPTGPTDVDDVPYFIIAVVEVKPVGKGKSSEVGKQMMKGLARVNLTDRLGEGYSKNPVYLLNKTSFGEVHVLTGNDGKPVPTVQQQFAKKFEGLKDKSSASDILRLAKWTLSHGLIGEFPKVMDKLVESNKDAPAAVAYRKVKGDLEKAAARDDASVAQLKKALGTSYRDVSGPHYTLFHSSAIPAVDVKSRLDQLENSFRGFYYWFALKGVALTAPSHRQLVVLTNSDKDFEQFQEVLTAGPVVVDGFFARRENLAVLSSQRQDESYDSLSKYYETWEGKGLRRADVLLRKPKPAELADGGKTFAEAQMLSVMLRALEKEAELATVSHDASRQLLFASGLLPRNVAAPEWLLFGMGSFFETPLQSPWPSLGAPSAYYLPRWNEMKGKGFEKTPGQTLRKVITDAYFRSVPPEGKSGSEERRAHDDAVRKARTASWSLTYFLATSERRFEGLQRYFQELGKMPRDIELDEEILLGCFARSFGLVDASNKVDVGKLDAELEKMGKEWFSYMDNVPFESEAIVKKIRQMFRDKLKEMQDASANARNNPQGQIDPRTGQPMQPGAYPPGAAGAYPPGPGRSMPQGPGRGAPQGPGRGRYNPQPQPQQPQRLPTSSDARQGTNKRPRR